MEEFISMVTQQLGIGASEGRSATGGILNLIKDQLDDSTFSTMMEKLPGAEGLLTAGEQSEAGSGGGLMGSLTSMAGSLMGGDSGIGGVAQALGNAGIGLDKAGGFLSALVEFLKGKLGDDLFGKIAGQLPDLLGGDK